MTADPDLAPRCDDCDIPLIRGARWGVWYCVNCDRDEATAMDAEDEARRAYGNCREYDDYVDFQCRIHGPGILAARRAEWEQREREEGRGRRGPYWRPEEHRVGIVEAYTQSNAGFRALRGRSDDIRVRRRWYFVTHDPLMQRAIDAVIGRDLMHATDRRNPLRRSLMHWRRCLLDSHPELLAHLRERVRLP